VAGLTDYRPLARLFSSPNLARLSAVATSASSRDRGFQPSSRSAFSPVAFFDCPSSEAICLSPGSAIETRRTSQSGSSRVGARLAEAPQASL
jgi:hypothetical protein